MNFNALLSTFMHMMSMFKGGSPLNMIMDSKKIPKGVCREVQGIAQQQGPNLEQYVRNEFQKMGLDVEGVLKAIGV